MHASSTTTPNNHNTGAFRRGVWSQDEHDRFLRALRDYPRGRSWRMIAECVGTRSVRQVQTHAQRFYEKITRRMNSGTQVKDRKSSSRPEHRIDHDILEFCRAHAGQGGLPLLYVGSSSASDTPADKEHKDDETKEGKLVEEEIEGGNALFLPTLDESLDFFIAHLSKELFSVQVVDARVYQLPVEKSWTGKIEEPAFCSASPMMTIPNGGDRV